MFTINLEQKLLDEKQHDLDTSGEDLIIAEANRLLKEADEAKLTALRNAGLSHNLDKQASILARRQQYDHYGQERVFSRKQIKAICVRYGLRFLPASSFKGAIDPQLAGKIVEFERKHPQTYAVGKEAKSGRNSYYIAAPAGSFRLTPNPKDPLFFAPLDSEGKTWCLVHKWGTDLSAWHWLRNLPQRNYSMFTLTLLLPCIPMLAVSASYDLPGLGLAGCFMLLLMRGLFGLPSLNEDTWDSPHE